MERVWDAPKSSVTLCQPKVIQGHQVNFNIFILGCVIYVLGQIFINNAKMALKHFLTPQIG